MKNQQNIPMENKFKIKHTPLITAVCIAALILCIVAVIVSVLRIINFGINGFNDVIKYPFLIAVSLFCIVLVISVLVKSQYVIDNQYLITQFGFVKSKFAIKDISAIVLDSDTYKLTVKFGEEYTVVSLDKEWNEDFARALLNIKPSIDYSFTFAENNEKIDK